MPSEHPKTTTSPNGLDLDSGPRGVVGHRLIRLYKSLREKSRTLQFRLTAWNTLVVAIVISVTLVGIYQAVRLFMLREFDSLLSEDIAEIKLTIKQLYPDWKRLENELNRKAQGHVHHMWFVRLFDVQGELLWSSFDAPDITLPVDIERKDRFFANKYPFRLAQARFEEPGIPSMIIRVGSSREPLLQEIALLGRVKVIGGVVAVLLAPFGGYWLASRAIRPVARIISTAARLQPSNLDQRLPIRHTGDELDQLSVTINSMLDRIASYIKQNRDFVANAAHELRSPLTAIRSSVDVALNTNRSQEEYAHLLGDVMEECAALQALVNRLLVLAETDAGLGLNGQMVPLDQLVRKSVDMFRGVAEAHGLTLDAVELPAVQVQGQESYLRQVVQNLIDNAIKFTPAGGRVAVAIRNDSEHNHAVLTVTDTGVGIAAEELPRIFERFYRGDRSRHHDACKRGSGLGLSICQSVVRALHGEIQVHSRVGEGTRFTVVLPSGK